MEKLNVTIENGVKTLEIRQGDALPLREKRQLIIIGNIDTVKEWLKFRVNEISQKSCNIRINRDKMAITLEINENDKLLDTIEGKLQLDEAFETFEINTGKYLTNFEMSDLIKMNRSHFENKSDAMKLVSELRNFKAKVDRDLENSDDNRGNRKLLINQIVESNLPENFKLHILIFKGLPKQTIEVEVNVRADDFCCTLISPDVNDIINETKDAIINEEIKQIRGLAPEIVIVEV